MMGLADVTVVWCGMGGTTKELYRSGTMLGFHSYDTGIPFFPLFRAGKDVETNFITIHSGSRAGGGRRGWRYQVTRRGGGRRGQ
jgi:hypothetical protein